MRGSFAFSITEQGCWLAILLFAFDRGGVGEVGWVAVLLLLPAALLAPLVAVASDAYPRHVVLTTGMRWSPQPRSASAPPCSPVRRSR